MRLQDRIAIITGAANGIGKETAKTFVREGANVVIADYDQELGQQVVEEIMEQGGKAFFHQVDVSDQTSVQSMVAATLQKWGRIDILINNAGITADGFLHKMSAEKWQKVIDVNLSGVFYCTQAVIPTMMEQKYGRILTASSVSGVYGNVGQTNYAATKAGVIGMTKTWAKELAPHGILVNAIAPGFVETRMVEKVPDKVLDQIKTMIPVGDFGSPTDIANAYLFLASEEARYITGTVLHVDGGIRM